MGRKPHKEIQKAAVGVSEPVRRTNNHHPITGRPDRCRSRIGDRRRIEDIEFRLGHVICGKRHVNGTYCEEQPDMEAHRCARHQKDGEALQDEFSLGVGYGMGDSQILHCRVCRDVSCDHYTADKKSDACYYELELYDELMKDKVRVVDTGVIAASTYDSLVMDTVLLNRIFRVLGTDGMMVTELKSFTPFEGALHPVKNQVDHPLLKHVPKLQQSVAQLANALELTPKSQTQKDDTSNENDFRATLKNMYAESIKANMEKKQ